MMPVSCTHYIASLDEGFVSRVIFIVDLLIHRRNVKWMRKQARGLLRKSKTTFNFYDHGDLPVEEVLLLEHTFTLD